ncbi:MAG: exopolysaccharide biosynthesis polyprenyl glycosylphosphotransferase [Candidatus Moranbacteria bacterium]|nr:exopolysaccharide biosynthesis polyprenyl glycosylphosphotransferase [Candidatus Moranbacteria bacterium]
MKRIGFIVAGDFLAFWLSLFVILTIRYSGSNSDIIIKHFGPFLILYIIWSLIFYLFDLYDIYKIKPNIPHLKQFGLAIMVSFVCGILMFYLIPSFGISPKTNLIFQTLGFGSISFLLRRFFYSVSAYQVVRPVILIGEEKYLDNLNKAISQNPQIGLKIVHYSADAHEALERFKDIKKAVFVIDTRTSFANSSALHNIRKNKNDILDISEAYEKYLFKIPVDCISESWIVENINDKSDLLYKIISRMIGVIFAILVLLIFSPVIFIVALLIKIEDGGPIFYTQKRVGLNDSNFNIIKIRSMKTNAEENGAQWTEANDTRITKVGRVIRKLHIDEVPQMINILKGDLALFGPRPERPEFVRELVKEIPHYDMRSIIRPGFTGWAQIKYRYANSVLTSKEKFEFDLYYIKNRNIFMDFGIFVRTVQVIFKH